MEETFMKRSKNVRIIFDSIFIALAIVVVFIWILYVVNNSDINPATREDYLPLEQQIFIVEQNPQLFLENEGKYTVKEEKMVAEFSNDECKIIAEYKIDESGNLNLISIEKKDRSWSIFTVVVFALITGILVGCLILMPYSVIREIVISINNHVKTKKENSRE